MQLFKAYRLLKVCLFIGSGVLRLYLDLIVVNFIKANISHFFVIFQSGNKANFLFRKFLNTYADI